MAEARVAARVVVIGGSAGAIDGLIALARRIPHDLPAAILVVVHISPESDSVLPSILSRSGPLQAVHPTDQTELLESTIYVAPPNRHLTVEAGRVRLGAGPHENGHRPAIDPLFRTAASVYGNAVLGIVLSGNLDDGAAGLRTIGQLGGVMAVQDPSEAMYDGMPRAAARAAGRAAHVLPVDELADLIVRWAMQPAERDAPNGGPPVPDVAVGGDEAVADSPYGSPSGFSCPHCGGSLFHLHEPNEDLQRFRCRTGHAYTAETLYAHQSARLEEALWSALRSLEETGAHARALSARMRAKGQNQIADRFQSRAAAAESRAEVVRSALLELETPEVMGETG